MVFLFSPHNLWFNPIDFFVSYTIKQKNTPQLFRTHFGESIIQDSGQRTRSNLVATVSAIFDDDSLFIETSELIDISLQNGSSIVM